MIEYDIFRNNNEITYDYGSFARTYRFKKCLHEEVTKFQHLMVMEHAVFGPVVLSNLDIMSGRDDSAYDLGIESLIPMNTKNVLILGGGDCSLASRLERWKSIERIEVVEIDSRVPYLFRRYVGKNDLSRAKLTIANAFDYSPDFEPDVVIDDMCPHLTVEEEKKHRLAIAYKYPFSLIISQTDTEYDGYGYRIQSSLEPECVIRDRCARFIPIYQEMWTFASFSLRL